MESGLTKAKTVTGRRPRQAGQTWPQPSSGALPKHARIYFPVVGLGASAGPRTSFAALPALDQRRDAAALCKLRETAATCVASLTSSQRQILDLVLVGHPSKNIAADLGISQRTVRQPSRGNHEEDGSGSLPALIRTAVAAACATRPRALPGLASW